MSKRSLSLIAILVTFLLSIPMQVSAVDAPPESHRGKVCNLSSRSVYAIAQLASNNWNWTRVNLSPNTCTPVSNSDVEGVWGKTCTSSGCSLQVYKVAGGSTVTLKDGGWMATTPNFYIKVSCSAWFGCGFQNPIPAEWMPFAPSTGWMNYTLK